MININFVGAIILVGWFGIKFVDENTEHAVIQYEGTNCYIPTKRFCFIKCINYLAGFDYLKTYLEFIRNEKQRSNVMTQARIQPCCKAINFNVGYYNVKDIYPITVTKINKALYLTENQ